jgi:hypothetical protein
VEQWQLVGLTRNINNMDTKLKGDIDLFYVFPVDVFIGYASEIHLVEADRRQRKPRSADYRDAWVLMVQWAAHRETCV